mgnify:CR=1 FL=1|tara:strand:+ start:12477 stop:14642 length:2166 start_codon:yes stop_codon:yes gene_type:complete
MQKLSLDLEHCYGIKRLQYTFDFSARRSYAVYAPNGAMKSSFAKTFADLSQKKIASDKVFPDRTTTCKICDEAGTALAPEAIMVILPYDQVLGHTAKTSTLLVNSTLRNEYEALHESVDLAKAAFLTAMKSQSGSKRDLESELSITFTASNKRFYDALLKVNEEVESKTSSHLSEIKYDIVFDDRAIDFIKTKDFKTAIETYIAKYNELISESRYFRKGIFNYYNASTISKQLSDNGFFKANHTLRLNSDETIEIHNEKDLEELIKAEKDKITNDTALKKTFLEIEKLLSKNANMRAFEAYIGENEHILPLFENVAEFKEAVWQSYIISHIDLYRDLVSKYRAAEKRRKEIEDQASAERTQWEEVIDIFNSRFFVPFTLVPKNRTSVILGEEPLLTLGFTFEEGEDTANIEREELIEVLSTGEKKALYILNIIFEIEVRRAAGQETILIIDDLADSFDYKNKYAIIQYLSDIGETGHFKQIILTHNFDFFRTLNSRLVGYSGCLMVTKDTTGVALAPAIGIRNVFINDWKVNFSDNAKKRISSIPFMRNLIEYTKGDTHPDYILMTSLLHWKDDTAEIQSSELYNIYNRLFEPAIQIDTTPGSVVDLIFSEALNCLNAPDGMNFENKVVLSIASRLCAEKFMVERINDAEAIGKISSTQTNGLLRLLSRRGLGTVNEIAILDRVALMTPENIHLNSFMYEPILDMSDQHLRSLYRAAATLS